MKRILLFPLFCLLICCSKNIERYVEMNHPAQNTTVSIEEAKSSVLTLMSKIDLQTKGVSSGRYIVDSFSYPSENTTKLFGEDLPIYIFNFNDNQGYAIASGDNRMPEVFCITEKGSFYVDSLSIPEGEAIFLSSIEEDYKILVSNDYIRNRADSLDIEDPPGGNPVLIDTWVVYGDRVTGSIHGSQIACKWGQGSPFYYYCPTSGADTCAVGCSFIL